MLFQKAVGWLHKTNARNIQKGFLSLSENDSELIIDNAI